MNEDEITPKTDIQAEAVEDEAQSAGEDKVVFKRTHLYSVLLPLAFVLGLSVGFLFWGRDRSAAPSAGPAAVAQPAAGQPAAPQAAAAQPQGAAQPAGEAQSVKRYDVPVDDDPAIGPEDAPITLIEFSDYECPFCSRWHSEVFSKIREDYPDQVRFVYRDFPLESSHPNAVPAAEAANCAAEQDSFWEFHDKLFSGENALSEPVYLQYAEDLGLGMEAFQECLDSGRYREEVMADYQFAAALGVRSTPTFFMNGIPLVGAQPYELFKEVIDKELAGEIP